MDTRFGVSAAAVELLLSECRMAGVSIQQIEQILKAQATGFFSWQDYLVACDAISELVGGPEAMAEMVEATFETTMPNLRELAPVFSTASEFVGFGARAMDASAFLGVRYDVQEHRRDRVVVRITASHGWSLRPTLLAGVVGAFRGGIRSYGHGSAEVELNTKPSSALLCVKLPSSLARKEPNRAHRGLLETLNAMTAKHREMLEAQHALVCELARIRHPAEIEERAARARKAWALTVRECEVLVAMCQGLTNKEIAASLQRAEGTVELHVTHLFKKLGVTNRSSVIARYFTL